MRRVILILLILMLMMSFINAIINHRLVFFNTYVWLVIALSSSFASVRAIRTGPNLYESKRLHNILAYSLLILSVFSIIFIIINAFLRPYII